jgi:hypothetical protein
MRVFASHAVRPFGAGSRASLSVQFAGPVSRLAGRLTRSLTDRYLALEADGLKQRSEERAASATHASRALARIHLPIAGLGIIFYSPWAVRHIPPGSDYLQDAFLEAADIARHVNGSTLTGFGTGGPGDYELEISGEPAAAEAVRAARHHVELGLEVRDGTVCFRDLYDLIRWDPACPPEQSVRLPDGFYRVIAYLTPSPLGETQFVHLAFTRTTARPELHFTGAPELC